MSLPNWTDEALRLSARAVGMSPPTERGVVDLNMPDVLGVFAPDYERERIKRELDTAGIRVLGEGQSVSPGDRFTFALIVGSTDAPKLQAIVNGEGNL